MNTIESIHLADRLAQITGESHAIVDIGGALHVRPLLDCLGMELLEVVRP